jgi:large subunit ribosomal protein L2
LAYADGEKRYIIAPKGLKVGAKVVSSNKTPEEFLPGCAYPLSIIPAATFLNCVELLPEQGAVIARSAGNAAQLVSVEGDNAILRMPSGEIRMVNKRCRATIGEVGNGDHITSRLPRLGRNRWLGRRPRVRGVAMNRSITPTVAARASPGWWRTPAPRLPVGPVAKGFPTRKRSKTSNVLIITRKKRP